MALYLGLMSGTSLDGADGVLVDLATQRKLLAQVHQPFDRDLRGELLALNESGADELHRAALAANGVARHYAELVRRLLAAARLPAASVTAIGAHGQTVRHRPGEFDGTGYTVQLLNGALLAELTAIDVVCDLRSRDVAAGGQGAPLVPAFHAACFGRDDADMAVLNLGGIANLTLLPREGAVLGFDCGPGNALLDYWVHRHRGEAFDADGRWAATGRVDTALLSRLRNEAYFDRNPPKSTGRDLFNPGWLARHLDAAATALAPQDVQATLLELTAGTVADALRRSLPQAGTLVVCGGGAFNQALVERIATQVAPTRVISSVEAAGIAPDHVEAMAFAWLAQRFVERRAGSLSAVTGARGPRVLGALYPGAAPQDGC